MARTAKLSLSTLLDILGWNGTFLLALIVFFKIFLDKEIDECPCEGNVAYGTVMLLLPAVSTFLLAVFVYYRQDDDAVPWCIFKTFYMLRRPCTFYDGSTSWELHSTQCIYCIQYDRDWINMKLVLSIVFSVLYPLLWLSLGFLHGNYYTCAKVGPYPEFLDYCDMSLDANDYQKTFTLATTLSLRIGALLFVGTFFFVAIFVVLYGELANYVKNAVQSTAIPELQVQVNLQPAPTSGEASHHGNEEGPISTQAISASTAQVDSKKAVRIELTGEFCSALQDYFEDGSWSGIGVNCSRTEVESHRRARRSARGQGATSSYESLPHLS